MLWKSSAHFSERIDAVWEGIYTLGEGSFNRGSRGFYGLEIYVPVRSARFASSEVGFFSETLDMKDRG